MLAEFLHATPRDIFAWLPAYTSERCLKTSSSGVSDGLDANDWNTVPKGHMGEKKMVSIYQMVLTETLFISSSRTSSRLGTYSRAHVDDDRQISSGKRLMEVREELLTESSFGKLSDRDENIYL